MIENFTFALINYLQGNYNCEQTPACHNINNTITAIQSHFDLYLRFKPQNKRILIIARISFMEVEQGHGTRFLRFISAEISKHNIDAVYLESVNLASFQFGKKIGFLDMQDGNMLISTEKLKDYFAGNT